MRIFAVLLLLLALLTVSKGYAQTVTLNVKNASLEEVFNEVQKQTGYSFLWDEQTLKNTAPVTFNAKNWPLVRVIETCILHQPLSYSIIDNIVLIKPGITAADTDAGILKNDALVKGRILDQSGQPLAAVTVSVKGKRIMALSDDDGIYAIPAKPEDTLLFSYTGSESKELPVSQRKSIEVVLQIIPNSLNEVVVVGYGIQNRKDLVGSIGVVSHEDFGDVSSSNISQLMQGKISGVQVINNDGEPGSGTQLVVRGTGSFTNTSPLFVIDGIQCDAITFNSLSKFDIQDITVLKDASSVAIYGAQGANGVVMITTRKPKNRKPQVTYSAYTGISGPWKQLSLLDAAQYTDLVKEWYANYGQPLPPRITQQEALVTKTDWQKEMFRTGKLTEHHIQIGGSSEFVNYSASVGYTRQESQVVNVDYQRANLRFNLEEHIGKRFTLGQQLNIRYEITNGIAANIIDGLRMPPYIPVYDANNSLGGFGIATSILDGNDSPNPLVEPKLRDAKNRGLNNYLQLFGEVKILKDLQFRSQFGGTFVFNQNYNFNPTYAANQLVTQSQINEGYAYNLGYILENYFTYDKMLRKSNINITLGNSYRNGGTFRAIDLAGSNFANNQIHQIGVAKTVNFSFGNANSSARFISYFGRINYTYNDKYIFTLTERRDATSLFNEENRVGYFPSAGAAWRVSKEKFMNTVTFFDDLKLRASIGKTGNSNIAGFSYESNVWTGSGNSVVYPLGFTEVLVNGATVAVPPSPNLRWETTLTTDIGIDATLLNNRLSVSLGYYNRDNKNLLVSVPLALSTGYGGVSGASSSQVINAASAFNRGVEVTAAYNGKVGDLMYYIGVNASHNKNEVKSLGTQGAVPVIGGAFYSVPSITRTEVGQPIGSFYGYVYDHVAIDVADVEKYDAIAKSITGDPGAIYQSGLLPGDRIFKDINGDGVVNESDQTFIGSPIPKWNYGINIRLQRNAFDLMAAVQGVAGADLVNGMKYYLEGVALPFNATTDVLSRWKQPGEVTDIARVGQNYGTSANLRNSSWFVENGSYLRVRNVTLGYTFSSAKLRSFTANAVAALRLYFTAQNLITITKYSGYDPEISSGLDDLIFSRGIDLGAVPQPRTFLFGVQLTFQ